MIEQEHRGWYKHGKLPHFDQAGLYQFITYRLDDTLPQAELERLESELSQSPLAAGAVETLRRKGIETLLDAGHGSCILRQPHNARLVTDSWRQFDGERYDVIIGVVMPNHVHVLVRIHPGSPLGELLKSWKTFTSRRFEVDRDLGYRPGWQRGYWDRFILNERHYRDAVRYIVFNPVKAGLVGAPQDWPYLVLGAGVELGVLEDAPPGGREC